MTGRLHCCEPQLRVLLSAVEMCGVLGAQPFGSWLDQLAVLCAASDFPAVSAPYAKSVICVFSSGDFAQHNSFDMKPEAPDNIYGEFKPIATRTPGVHICEHLP